MTTPVGTQSQTPIKTEVHTAEPEAMPDLDALSAPIKPATVAKPVSSAGVSSAALANAGAADGAGAASAVFTQQLRDHAAIVLNTFRQSNLDRVTKRGNLEDAQKLAAQIKTMSQFDIGKVGAEDQEAIRTQSATMLEGSKAKDLGEAGDILLKATGTMQGFDMKITVPQQVAKKAGGFLSMFSRENITEQAGNAKKAVETAFNDWKNRRAEVNSLVETISDEMYNTASSLNRRIGELEVAFGACVESLKKVEISVAGLSLALLELNNTEIPELLRALEKDPGNTELKQKLADAREKAATIDRRIGSLGKSASTIGNALPTIRLMQNNNNGLVEAMNTARTDTVAQWQLLLMQAQTLHEAKQAAGALQAMATADAQMRKQAAENLKENTAAVQDILENGVTSYESLDYQNQKLIEAMTELYAKQQQAAEARRAAEDRMEASNRELGAVIARGGAPDPSTAKF